MIRSSAVVVLAAFACGQPSQRTELLGNVGTAAESDGAWMYIPGDAVMVWFESPMRPMYPLPENSAECQTEFAQFPGGFRVERPGERQAQILIGDIPREELTRCLVNGINISAEIGGGMKVTATTEGDLTRLGGLWLGWHTGFVVIDEGEALTRNPAVPPSYREMNRAKLAFWTRRPIVKAILGVPAEELLVRLDTWETTDIEWQRRIAGTIELRFSSVAETRQAAAKLSSGSISMKEPALLRVLASAKSEVVDTTLRLRLTKVDIPFGALLDELSPVLSSP